MVIPFHSSLPAHLLVAYSVSQANFRSIPIRLMNTSNIDFELQAGQKVVQFSPLVEFFPTPITPKDPDQNNQAYSIISSDIKGQIEAAVSKDLCPSDKQ